MSLPRGAGYRILRAAAETADDSRTGVWEVGRVDDLEAAERNGSPRD